MLWLHAARADARLTQRLAMEVARAEYVVCACMNATHYVSVLRDMGRGSLRASMRVRVRAKVVFRSQRLDSRPPCYYAAGTRRRVATPMRACCFTLRSANGASWLR